VNKRLFVGGLPFSMTDEGLRKLFEEGDETDGSITGCGTGTVESGAEKTGVVRDRVTGKSKGFGFVQMISEEAAEKAIQLLNGVIYKNRALKVDKAAQRRSAPTRSGGGGNSGYRGHRSNDYHGNSNGSYNRYSNREDRY
jgi:RNA recognition motif-containing protein